MPTLELETIKLEGSTDGQSYVSLHVAINDRTITVDSTAYFKLSGVDEFYRFFRLTCTGNDQASSACYRFHISNFELYGDLKGLSERS